MQVTQRKFESEMPEENQLNRGKDFTPLKQTMNEELDEEAKKLEKKQRKELIKLKKESLAQYAIKGTDDDWKKALTNVAGKKSIVSVKSGEKRGAETIDEEENQTEDKPGWNKNKKKKFQGQEKFQAKRGKKDKFFK